ncbi:condensin complex subunit 2 [Stylonychia lemnae]|uniref:Condensin complex subunit 2 n=1 Tax=Stylonychia lemnae TaxID=5949 RepID=A0A078A9G1_STYLE|nr:condensin complex subunit 2 [Stylonychia lemnae]|eukprot:CDW77428.1 condensin complex subunit 2 [Stylonychia lemnae]
MRISAQNSSQKEIMSQQDQTRQHADHAVHMIFQNKVNAKNAFDLDIDFVENLTMLLGDRRDNESSWLRASASLDAGTKIYAFRVDQVHQETYKILGGLHRQEQAAKNQVDSSNSSSAPASEQDLFTIMNNLADQDSSNQAAQIKKGIKKPGQNFVYSGGERTLEKDSKNLDVTRFDIEAEIDPLFRQRTARFDESGAKNLLINITNVDKGLNIQLDSEVAEANRIKMVKPHKRKQDKSIEEIEQEKEDELKLQKWNSEYILSCKQVFKMEGVDTLCGQRMSRELDIKRKEIYEYMGGIKIKQKINRDKQMEQEQISAQSEMSIIQSEMMTEMDELDKFIQQVIENDNKKAAPILPQPNLPQQFNDPSKPKQQHHDGCFIGGDFDSQSMSHTKFNDPFAAQLQSESNTNGIQMQMNEYEEGFAQAQSDNDIYMETQDQEQQNCRDPSYADQGMDNYDYQNDDERIQDEIELERQQAQLEDQEELKLFNQAVNNDNPVTAEDLKNQNKRLQEEKIDQTRLSDLRDAQKLLNLDGRFKIKDQLGTGKQEVFDDLRRSLVSKDGDSCLDSDILRREKQKREIKKRMIDDEVLKSYDQVQPSQDSTQRDKIKKAQSQSQISKNSVSAGLQIEKYLKETRCKDIRPQHLDRYKPNDMKNIASKNAQRFALQFYETHPLKRLSRLFSRTTWLKIAEIDPSNRHRIGASIQEELNNPAQFLNPEDPGSSISITSAFSYKKPEMSQLSNRSQMNNDVNESSHMSFIQENTNRVMTTVNENGNYKYIKSRFKNFKRGDLESFGTTSSSNRSQITKENNKKASWENDCGRGKKFRARIGFQFDKFNYEQY